MSASAAQAARFARAFTQKAKKASPFLAVGLSTAYSAKEYLPSPTEFTRQLLAEGIASSIPDRYDRKYIINNICIPAIHQELDTFIDDNIHFQYLRDILHKEAHELFISIDKIIKSQNPVTRTANTEPNPFLQSATDQFREASHSLGNSLGRKINTIKTQSTTSQIIADFYCKPFMKNILINIANKIKINNPETASSMDNFIRGVDDRHEPEAEPELKGGRIRRKKRKQRKTRKIRSCT
jgi:hypothetical protein